MRPNETELKVCHSYALLRVVPNAPVIPAKAGIQATMRVDANATELKFCHSYALLRVVPNPKLPPEMQSNATKCNQMQLN